MSFENSPTLEEVGNGAPVEIPERNGTRNILLGIGFVIVVLLGVLFFQSDGFAVLAGRGTISGVALNESGEPIVAEILIFDTDLKALSNAQGFFSVANVPAGKRSVIVSYGQIATEKIALVTAGEITDLGAVTVPTGEEIDY